MLQRETDSGRKKEAMGSARQSNREEERGWQVVLKLLTRVASAGWLAGLGLALMLLLGSDRNRIKVLVHFFTEMILAPNMIQIIFQKN